MKEQTLKEKVEHYLCSGIPIIFINSFEENKTDLIIKSVLHNKKAFEWSLARGISDFQTGENQEKISLKDYLELIIDSDLNSELDNHVLILKDVYYLLQDNEVVSLLKYICLKISQKLDATLIIVSSQFFLPPELEKYTIVLESDYPKQNEIKNHIKNFLERNYIDNIDESFLEELSVAMKGMCDIEIDSILSSAIAKEGTLSKDDLRLVYSQKQQIIRKSGILEMIPADENLENIGGLNNLKNWLKRKSEVFKNIKKAEEFGVDIPKGVLVAGIPGCGKSLTAKVTANLFNVPLLRLDVGKLLGKYVGESEQNMRKAIKLAEAISPCILWIDELEKAFAGVGSGGEGNEVTVRLFGTFLTWMQEKKSSVFVIATANDISKLPPELLRKGRFDEIFYIGLPEQNERAEIFKIHISKRRNNDAKLINISLLAEKTKGFCGADIEGVIKDSVETAFYEKKNNLTTDDVLKAISDTHSLSEIMKESIEAMSKIYKDRKFKNASTD